MSRQKPTREVFRMSGHNPFRNRKSAKVVAAERRARKEQSFLDSLAVRTDDPDSVLDDEGNLLPIRTLAGSPPDGTSFYLGSTQVPLVSVLNSIRVISECAARVKALVGK
jgi:hypothetical protein